MDVEVLPSLTPMLFYFTLLFFDLCIELFDFVMHAYITNFLIKINPPANVPNTVNPNT